MPAAVHRMPNPTAGANLSIPRASSPLWSEWGARLRPHLPGLSTPEACRLALRMWRWQSSKTINVLAWLEGRREIRWKEGAWWSR